jgi:DNA helicase-2/ATP-dependent DNA helicase PcrA
LLDGLTDAQRAAVTSEAQPLCILAGAGSGKTRVLTRRIAHRVMTGSAEAQHVVAVTFTRKAAGELRHRLSTLGLRDGVAAGTFHSLALSQLRRWWSENNRPEPTILDRKVRIIAPLLGGRRLGPAVQAMDIASEIEWAKARGINPSRYEEEAVAAGRKPAVPLDAFAALYERYETEKKRRGLVDFDDLLWQAGTALHDDPQFATATRWRMRHLFVDEFQDVNPVQFRLLSGWLGDRVDLCVVGDPNQAIYSWNGADPTLLTEFGKRFPAAEVLTLTDNFRSTPQILATANAVLADGRAGRESAELVAHSADGALPAIVAYASDTDEARGLARTVRGARKPGRNWSSIAILVRTNAQAIPICEALAAGGVPYRVRGDGAFLQQPEIRDALATLRRLPKATPVRSAVDDLEQLVADGAGTDERRANIEELVRLAREYDALEPLGSVTSFVAWLQATVKAEAPDISDDAVEVVTFHRAKGLEWPVVFIAGLERGLVPIGHATTPAAEAEERRLLYVAITRAREVVRCSWAERRTFGAKSIPRSPSPYLEPIEMTIALLAKGVAPRDLRAKIAAERDRIKPLPVRRAGENADPDVVSALKAWRANLGAHRRRTGLRDLPRHHARGAGRSDADPSERPPRRPRHWPGESRALRCRRAARRRRVPRRFVKFFVEQRYTAALDAVEEAYCSPELLGLLASLPKVGGAELLDQQRDANRVTQRVRYRFTGDLSSAVTAVIDPAKLSWVEESVLDRATHVTTWHIVADHYASRLSCAGTFRLAARGNETVRTTEAELKVHFPLVGGRVEKAIVSGLKEHATAEQLAVEAFLKH